MNEATERLNEAAAVIEDAQTEVREIVKYAYLHSEPKYITQQKLLRVITRAAAKIKIRRLAVDTQKALWNFAESQRRIWSNSFSPEILLFLGARVAYYTEAKGFVSQTPLKADETRLVREIEDAIGRPARLFNKGVPLGRFYQDVWNEHVKPLVDRLANHVALDPNDYTGRNSLRNLAEMEVRYQEHLDTIEDFKNRSVKLVVCSSHADCSDRCAEWQGRIYSLDGTSGVIDGHKYVPLETATDIWYTTKAGRRYKNGLLGFNCRHRITEYKGQIPPTISAKERKKEYAITLQQRLMEREVRREKVKALILKDINKRGYDEARAAARTAYERYKEFSRKNERAFYPMRVAI